MIIYQAPKLSFLGDLEESRIDQLLVDGFRERLGRGVAPSEVGSWRNSLQYVGNVLRDPLIPDDLGVSVECQIPRTSKRIDVILTGQGRAGSDHAVIVELKQWERAAKTAKDGIVLTFLGEPNGRQFTPVIRPGVTRHCWNSSTRRSKPEESYSTHVLFFTIAPIPQD